MINGQVSFWQRQLGPPPARRPLTGSRDADVCVIGGGFTGLWTAYYLAKADPGLRIAVVEQRFCGYGASGRNGGWLTAELAGSRQRYAETHGREPVLALQQAMIDTVAEVCRAAEAEGIDADIAREGVLSIAVNAAQLERLRAEHEADRAWGSPDHVWQSADRTRDMIAIPGAVGSRWWPHCARIHPAKLVRGLARTVEDLGVTIYERSTVEGFDARRVRTARGSVKADVVVRATEGFTGGLPGLRRTWLPMNSCMVVTEPLGDAVWRAIGWQRPVVLGDQAHVYMYAQRTADGRIALGGRGVPYRFGSRTDRDGVVQPSAVAALTAVLHRYFPAAARARIEQAWSGVLGVPRDWCSTVGFDEADGMAWAGGYTGHGVATANLSGRTLCDLILRRDTELVHLPWVGRSARLWEPEPLRFVGVRGLYAAYRMADRRERHRTSTSIIAKVADRISGRT